MSDYESLAGIKARPGSSLVLTDRTTSIASAGAPIVAILETNQLRKWALIANSPLNTANFYINFGGATYVLPPGGSILINENMPYTGLVTGQQIDVASASVDVTEASIERG